MTGSLVASVLGDLRARGVRLEVRDGRLRFQPAEAVDQGLRERMASCKAELLAVLQAEARDRAGAPEGEAVLPEWLLAGPGSSSGASKGRMGAVPRAQCYCCGSTRWWRLQTGGPWVCPTCHPPGAAIGALEWWGGEVQP